MATDELAGFVCTQCGQCCRVPGFVRLSLEDVERIAAFSGLRPEVFTEQFTRLMPDRSGLALLEHGDGACAHLGEDGKCRIQSVKPMQCRGFPYTWRYPDIASICEGWKT